MYRPTRRKLLKHLAVSTIAAPVTISGTKSSGQVIGANDRIRVAIAGINGRGQVHMRVFGDMKDVEVAYLVDPDSRLFASRSAAVESHTGKKPTCVQDIRQALEDQTVDAVSIATPNHWHALMTLWACQAGKDVYVEKPCSHNIVEGRQMLDAASRYGRIVQHGTQWRSDPKWQAYTSAIRKGKYGKLQTANIQIFRPRTSIGFKQAVKPPQELDYDLWVGPAPKHSYRPNLVHYQWHWIWDYGNGEIANLGSHEFEMARWAMPEGALPQSVISLGGRFGYEDQGQTPNTQLSVFDFGETKLICQQRGLHKEKSIKMSIDFHTDAGVVRDGKFFPRGHRQEEVIENAPAEGLPENYAREHFENFIACVRSRKQEDLNGPLLDGHRTAMLAHLGNISYRMGEDVPFRQQPSELFGNQLAHESLEGMKRHLVDMANIDLSNTPYRLGRALQFDAETEKFVGSPEADQMLGKTYRESFALPN